MATHRFAFTISGGLAMGAYEAGVLAQLYRDIASFNNANLGSNLVIDVISGASAGSITGLILAQALALNLQPDQFASIIEAAWIDGPDITALLQPANGSEEALFTEQRIDKIAAAAIKPEDTDELVDFKDVIAIWMAITNLEGIPYSLQFTGGSRPATVYDYNYHDYAPYFISGKIIRNVSIPTESLAEPLPANPLDWWYRCTETNWSEAATIAIASGSFPFAFSTKPLERDLNLYGDYKDFKQPDWPDSLTLQVTDGGLLGNEPIGKAIDAVTYLERLDPTRTYDPRTYLIIQPHPATLTDIGAALKAVDNEDAPNGLAFPTVLGRLISVYFNTSLFSDFQTAIQINEQLEAIEKIGLDKETKRKVLAAVGLDFKRPITLERIPADIPSENRLAGDFFGDFGGFLQQDFREFDYSVGRVEARSWFKNWLQFSAKSLAVDPDTAVHALGNDPQTPAIDLADSDWCKNMTEDRRNEIVNQALARVEQLLFRWFNLNFWEKAGLVGLRHLLGGEIHKKFVDCSDE